MKNLQRSVNLMAILFAALLLAACGGGGGGGGNDDGGGGGDDGPTYSGSTNEATVDDQSEAEDVSRAAGEGTLAAIRQNEAQEVAPLSGGTSMSLSAEGVAEHNLEVIRQAETGSYSLTPQAASTVDGVCGGTATVDSESNTDGTVSTGSVVYNDFCVSSGTSGEAVFNGTVEFTIETNSSGELVSYEFSYQNFTVTAGGETQTLNASLSCTFSSNVLVGCTTTSDFEGTDGRTYRTTNVTVTGDSTGYGVEATVYDPDHGYVTIDASGITTNCANGNIDGGTITISDSTGTNVVTVTFNDCSSYTVSYNGGTGTIQNW